KGAGQRPAFNRSFNLESAHAGWHRASSAMPSRETSAGVGEKQVNTADVRDELAGELAPAWILLLGIAQRPLEVVEIGVDHVLERRLAAIAMADFVECRPAFVGVDGA